MIIQKSKKKSKKTRFFGRFLGVLQKSVEKIEGQLLIFEKIEIEKNIEKLIFEKIEIEKNIEKLIFEKIEIEKNID